MVTPMRTVIMDPGMGQEMAADGDGRSISSRGKRYRNAMNLVLS
jgi:hypothetical protein